MNPQTKRCPKCAQTKPMQAFHRHACRKDGHKSFCKSCTSSINREYKSRAEVKARMVAYYEKRKPSEAERQARARASEDVRKAYRDSEEYKALVSERKERERLRSIAYAQTQAFKGRDKDRFEKHRDCLSDEYIKRQLSKGKFAIPRSMMTDDLIQLKRVHLELKRKIWEMV